MLFLLSAPSGSAKKVPAWGPHLFFKVAIYGFLAPYAKCSPGYRGEPLSVDVFIALLARAKAAFVYTTEGRTGVSKLVEFSVEVTNRKCAL
jgi:hypothetical protein